MADQEVDLDRGTQKVNAILHPDGKPAKKRRSDAGVPRKKAEPGMLTAEQGKIVRNLGASLFAAMGERVAAEQREAAADKAFTDYLDSLTVK